MEVPRRDIITLIAAASAYEAYGMKYDPFGKTRKKDFDGAIKSVTNWLKNVQCPSSLTPKKKATEHNDKSPKARG